MQGVREEVALLKEAAIQKEQEKRQLKEAVQQLTTDLQVCWSVACFMLALRN